APAGHTPRQAFRVREGAFRRSRLRAAHARVRVARACAGRWNLPLPYPPGWRPRPLALLPARRPLPRERHLELASHAPWRVADRRSKRLRLTRAGRAEQRAMDEASNALATSTLEPLTDKQRERLLRAEDDVRRLLALSMFSIAVEDPSSGDARWCLEHYFAEL